MKLVLGPVCMHIMYHEYLSVHFYICFLFMLVKKKIRGNETSEHKKGGFCRIIDTLWNKMLSPVFINAIKAYCLSLCNAL